jgi:hypothetical protein
MAVANYLERRIVIRVDNRDSIYTAGDLLLDKIAFSYLRPAPKGGGLNDDWRSLSCKRILLFQTFSCTSSVLCLCFRQSLEYDNQHNIYLLELLRDGKDKDYCRIFKQFWFFSFLSRN